MEEALHKRALRGMPRALREWEVVEVIEVCSTTGGVGWRRVGWRRASQHAGQQTGLVPVCHLAVRPTPPPCPTPVQQAAAFHLMRENATYFGTGARTAVAWAKWACWPMQLWPKRRVRRPSMRSDGARAAARSRGSQFLRCIKYTRFGTTVLLRLICDTVVDGSIRCICSISAQR